MSSNGHKTDSVYSVKEKGRACDRCRRLKRRCVGGEICNHCSAQNLGCTYQEQATNRTINDIHDPGGLHTLDYIKNLELRLKTAETAAQQKPRPPDLISGLLKALPKPIAPHPDDSEPLGIVASLQALSLDEPLVDPGFQGSFSDAMLVKVAVAVKSGEPTTLKSPAANPRNVKPLLQSDNNSTILQFSFMDDTLMSSLVLLYFANINAFIPVLHRPTFEQGVFQGFHLRQEHFASTLLLVCALGSLYLPEASKLYPDRLNLAWTCYDQVEFCGHSLRRRPTTSDLQAYCLGAQFLICTSNPRAAWKIVGFGLRFAEDIGSHWRNFRAPVISAEEELERRATWTLITLDAQLGAALGRSMTLDPFQFDIALPSECDDGYWQVSGPKSQPPHIPCTITFFNRIVDLYRILHFMLKNLYSTSRYYTATRIEDLRALAVELDRALDNCFNSVPLHLIWDPKRRDTLFFEQSAALHCFYYYTRMLIHRPFIPTGQLTTQPELRALQTCTKAARACINVADIHHQRRPDRPLFLSQSPLFTAAVVLILNTWHWGCSQRTDDRAQDLANVHVALDILRPQQTRWPSSGFLVTVLERLLALDCPPVTQTDDRSDGAGSADPVADIDSEVMTTAEGLDRAAWVGLARAWLTSAKVPGDKDSLPQMVAMPPVFVGDQELPDRRQAAARCVLGEWNC
ncbi:fungal-specific transcription factor domain-containing protein [Mycena polygramma]|nr:fungal-specific transcription factor domain-containing protein [Mycena polygramma]